MTFVHIYGLHGPDGVVRYVGSTVNVAHRLAQHRHAAFNPACHEYHLDRSAWIRGIGRDNIQIRLLESFEESSIRIHVEREWIRSLFEFGFDLFNIQDSPDTSPRRWTWLGSTFDHRRTPRARDAQAEVARKYLRTPESVAKAAASVRSPERRAAASAQMSGEGHNMAKLKEFQVLDMLKRGKYGTYKDIASDYGVSIYAVRDIFYGRSWKHIDRSKI